MLARLRAVCLCMLATAAHAGTTAAQMPTVPVTLTRLELNIAID